MYTIYIIAAIEANAIQYWPSACEIARGPGHRARRRQQGPAQNFNVFHWTIVFFSHAGVLVHAHGACARGRVEQVVRYVNAVFNQLHDLLDASAIVDPELD